MTSAQPDNPNAAPTTAPQPHTSQQPIRIGVLALQGSFREHMALLSQLPNVQVVEVRTKDELNSVAGLIIPGGESTTMALVAEQWGLIPELQAFAKAGRPVWGTCAGMIFLAERAEGEACGWFCCWGRVCLQLGDWVWRWGVFHVRAGTTAGTD